MKEAQGLQRGRVGARPAKARRARGTMSAAPAPRLVPARVLIRPTRPDDLEEAALLERRVWGRLAASLNELQRRLFALPEAFLLAELQVPGRPAQIVGLTNALVWTREFPRSYAGYEKMLPSASHNPRGDILYVASIGVDPGLRGRGVGSRLLEETLEVGRRRHLKVARLIANSRSQSLYIRAGFAVVRPLPGLFRRHRDLMPKPALMECPLA